MKVFKMHNATKGAAQLVWLLSAALLVSGCAEKKNKSDFHESPIQHQDIKTDVPDKPKPVEPAEDTAQEEQEGKMVFRTETFGNEGFWSDAARLPQGLMSKKITPLGLLKLGVSINYDLLEPELARSLKREILKEGLEGKLLNSPDMTTHLLNANAVIGLIVKDSNRDGRLNIKQGDKLGVSCVLCHGGTNKSLFELPGGGSIGRPVDGPAVHRLNLGAILSIASNTRAFYPMAQIKDEDGKSIGRAPSDAGLTKESTEEQFDAYFSNPSYYPVGSFDDTLDGFGNPMRIAPAFRVDLAAPFGSAGEFATLSQYANHIFTAAMDPTNILTKAGRQFMERISGSHGVRLTEDYADVLKATNVLGHPYVKNEEKISLGQDGGIFGVHVDQKKLSVLKTYLTKLRSPKGQAMTKASALKGEAIFKSSKTGCTACHNLDQRVAVMKDIVDMNVIFRGDNPVVFRKRDNLVNPLQDTAGSTYDDKMIVINAAIRGLNRGVALPLLMDLGKKPAYLHNGGVPTLNKLFDPERGDKAPHGFYIENPDDRKDLVAYLKGLDDNDGK